MGGSKKMSEFLVIRFPEELTLSYAVAERADRAQNQPKCTRPSRSWYYPQHPSSGYSGSA